MAMISIESSEAAPCPRRRVTITATSTPPTGSVTWNVGTGPHDTFTMVGGVPLIGTHFDGQGNLILPNGVSEATGDTITISGSSGEIRVVTATHGDPNGQPASPVTSLSTTVRWRVAEVQVELVPPPPYLIDATPMMPSISIAVHGSGGSTVGMNRRATAGLREFSDCPPHGPRDLDTTIEIPVGPGGTIDFGDIVRGGSLNVSVSGSINGCEVAAFGGGGISGTNPSLAEVRAALPNDTLRRIACKESGQRQFRAAPDGGIDFCPVFGRDGRVGVMQIRNPTPEAVWNWRANVREGTDLFERKTAEARAYPARVRATARFQDLVTQFNADRLQVGRPPVSVELPEFSVGDFDGNLQQLELDVIRGYDGWSGADGFGNELHEFRVDTETVDGRETLLVDAVDEVALTCQAKWRRVEPGARPLGPGDPDYVAAVLGFFPDCSGNADVELFPCGGTTIHITDSGSRFDPPSTSGITIVVGVVKPASLIGEMRWCEKNVDGFRGSIDVEGATTLGATSEATIRARRPGRARLRFRRGECNQPIGTAACLDSVDLSVPHFFFMDFLPSFDEDLARLGLMRRSNPDGSPLTAEQAQVNQAARDRVIETALELARRNFDRANVRFLRTSPNQVVGTGNFTRLQIGGPDPTQPSLEYGFVTKNPADPFTPDKEVVVHSGEFARRNSFITNNLTYVGIFDPIAVRDATGAELTGTPVDDGDLDGAPSQRELVLEAAVLAFGNFVGSVASHEAGHVIIPELDLHGTAAGTLMKPGGATFEEYTGITFFRAEIFQLVTTDPITFSPGHREALAHRLPLDENS